MADFRFARMTMIAALAMAPAAGFADDDAPGTAAAPADVEAAVEEAKPQARVAEEAQPLLEQVGAAYARLESLELSGKIVLRVVENGKERTNTAEFASAFQAPNKFRHEIKDDVLIGSTGEKVYAHAPLNNVYLQAPAPSGRAAWSELPEDHARMLATQNVGLGLSLTEDAQRELREMASEINKGADEEIEGRTHNALRLKLNEDESVLTLLIDPETHLIRRSVIDLTPMFAKRGREDIKDAQLVVDYATVSPGAQVKAEQFAWAPPEGARDIVAVRAAAADGGEMAASEMIGKPAPDFGLAGLDGQQVSLADLKGSVVVLDFWATWCGPCVASMPHLEKLHQDLAKDGLKLYAINLRENKETVEEFMKQRGLTMPVLFDPEGQVAAQYQVTGIPHSVVIGKDGVVKKVTIGFNPAGENELRQAVVELLRAK